MQGSIPLQAGWGGTRGAQGSEEGRDGRDPKPILFQVSAWMLRAAPNSGSCSCHRLSGRSPWERFACTVACVLGALWV